MSIGLVRWSRKCARGDGERNAGARGKAARGLVGHQRRRTAASAESGDRPRSVSAISVPALFRHLASGDNVREPSGMLKRSLTEGHFPEAGVMSALSMSR
jgi:hypothetical protein